LPFLEVSKLKTQIKLATIKKFITTKQDQKRSAVFKKPSPPRKHTKCKGHEDACGKLGHTWYECFNNPKNLHKRPDYWNKNPSKTNKIPKEKLNMAFSSEQVLHMFNMMQNNLKAMPKNKRKASEIEANEELKEIFKVAIYKPKYSDSDTKYFLLSSQNNSKLNKI
jgi:hypothetical protein